MATLEFIQKRIEGKTKEISKLEKKLERIHKAEATGWAVNPYYYDERDLKYTTKDLDEAKQALAKWVEEFEKATEKANSRNIKVILDFLDMWKERMRKFYIYSISQYERAYKVFCEKDHEFCEWHNSGACKKCSKEERKRIEDEAREERRNFRQAWAYLYPYLMYDWEDGVRVHSLDLEKLDKDLNAEADAKYDDIIERTNEITGKITDASELEIGAKGELNGFIIGERGTAKVNTIGAGGYNIQCYHFRTLVHRI